MKVIFIRHAEQENLDEDSYLTDKGIKQAKLLAKRLKRENFDEFYCSNLKRSKQTADIVSKKIDIKPKIEKSLNEFESETIKRDKSKWDKEERSHYEELISFLRKIAKNLGEDKSILIIAHGITNRIVLSYFLNLNLKTLIRFTQKETGINSVYWKKEFKNWRLNFWNDDNHIPLRLR